MSSEIVLQLPEIKVRVLRWDGASSGTPVVLLPATGEIADSWDSVAVRLSPARTVYALDLRGHGGSDWSGEYAITSMAEDVVQVLSRLVAGPVDLVGHSLGGLVACHVASRAPERVRRLVLEDVGVLHPRVPAPPQRPTGDLPFDWGMVDQVRRQIDEPSADWPEVLASIQCPMLVIAGGDASPVSAEHVRELVGLVADGRVITVETGHFVHESDPQVFCEHLQTFLDA